MKKIITILGARPQFIKAAAVSAVFKGNIEEILVHTGQHYDANMSDVFFEELNIPKPKYHLNIGSGSHGEQTGEMLKAIEQVLLDEKPDCVMVYGDTNSTLAGALAASKLLIPVIHVEAGLRSFNKAMPEEQNRILTDHVSSLLFVPTQTAVDNLTNEGITNGVHLVGDVMYDGILHFSKIAAEKSGILEKNQLENNQFVLCTIHRAENTNDPARLRAIFKGLNQSKIK
ncbi:MAG TPA: UDP-N-acetylglucosamine 2-epimerase (non-hydrolyzing), partial [Fluviicola sp.]|nr:UDP-N-acetylglucosamine 2-epimerase (non-hydrolyzing) [Fluviicola sp.]